MEFNYEVDASNYRQILLDFPTQFKEALSLGAGVQINAPIEQIVVIAMGGSGLAGRLLQNYMSKVDSKIPVHLIQDYNIPEHALKNALVFVVSYSGNTDETLAAYRQIGRGGSPCVVISSGGKLEQIAPMFSSDFIKIPRDDIPPRVATAYLFVPMLLVLMKNNVIPNASYALNGIAESLKKDIYEAYAKDLVEKVGVKTPVIYAPSTQSALAYKWKIALNESAKTFAFSNVFPECLHNELECFNASSDSINDFVALLLKDVKDRGKTPAMMDNFKDVLRKKGAHALEVVIRSPDSLTYMFSAMYLGDWFAYYMALAKGVDPMKIDTIEAFKKKA